jgi:hypothetical protein
MYPPQDDPIAANPDWICYALRNQAVDASHHVRHFTDAQVTYIQTAKRRAVPRAASVIGSTTNAPFARNSCTGYAYSTGDNVGFDVSAGPP